jgi:hypothetical protein
LWTIQTEDSWRQLEAGGVLRANRKNVPEEHSLLAYAWMVEQMKTRIGPPPAPPCFPVWAWYQWQGEKRRKPDLRASGHLERGKRGVRIEFEVPDESVLLSDFELWHFALNYWYLPESDADDERFEAELAAHGLSLYKQKPLLIARYHRGIIRSWERMFDLDWSERGFAAPRPRKSIQATLWELRRDEVRGCTHFLSR